MFAHKLSKRTLSPLLRNCPSSILDIYLHKNEYSVSNVVDITSTQMEEFFVETNNKMTKLCNIKYPIVSAPMGFASGVKLASEVSKVGGMGMVGFGIMNKEWIDQEMQLINTQINDKQFGWGFISWHLDILNSSNNQGDNIIHHILETCNPSSMMFSFGNAKRYINIINNFNKTNNKDVLILSQINTIDQAIDAAQYSDIIIAQGNEAGGHGMSNMSVSTLIPAIRDSLNNNKYHDKVLLAAGGITDGRGVSSALCLGADGVLIGTRYLASDECLYPDDAKNMYLNINGQDTVRHKIFDMLFAGPPYNLERFMELGYDARTATNDVIQRCNINDETRLLECIEEQRATWNDLNQFILAGEGVGCVNSVDSAKHITETIIKQTVEQFKRFNSSLR